MYHLILARMPGIYRLLRSLYNPKPYSSKIINILSLAYFNMERYNAWVSPSFSSTLALNRLLETTWNDLASLSDTPFPWQEVLPLVEASNLGGLVYSISRNMRPSPPIDVLQVLEKEYYRIITSNTRVLHQLTLVYGALSCVGSPVLLLKGAAMAQALYRNPMVRLIGDIDLVIPLEYVSACRKVLLELGYSPSEVDHQHGIPFGHKNEEAFFLPIPGRAVVELHWHVLDVPYYMRKIPMDWFWTNTQEMSIEGQPFLVLNPEANLVYLPAHLALHHQFTRLHSLLDLALLVDQNKESLDWHKVVAAAREFELISVLGATLNHLVQRWPSLPLAESHRLLEDLKPTHTDASLFRLLTSKERNHNLDFYTTLKSLPNFQARMRYAWRNMFPQPAYMLGRYAINARWQLPLYYIYRLAYGLLRFLVVLPRARRIS